MTRSFELLLYESIVCRIVVLCRYGGLDKSRCIAYASAVVAFVGRDALVM